MRIMRGYTRFVILIGPYALKIARIRLLKTLYLVGRGVYRRFFGDRLWYSVYERKYPTHPVLMVWHHTFIGLYANRAEWRYWQQTSDEQCVPLLRQWWGGMVVVQYRASGVTEADILASSLQEVYRTDFELSRPEQYGRYDGAPRVLDFAHWGGFDFGQQK